MAESEEEEPSLTVKDRRKFNLDGSVREGFEPEQPKNADSVKEIGNSAPSFVAETSPDAGTATSETESEEAEVPGADDPASFVNFLSTLVTNAAASLGAMPHPVTGKRTLDLETGKYWLDVLSMLREKTDGNLHSKEAQIFDGILGDLKMQYVQLVRATEEKLKQQAASKFSTNDILGRK